MASRTAEIVDMGLTMALRGVGHMKRRASMHRVDVERLARQLTALGRIEDELKALGVDIVAHGDDDTRRLLEQMKASNEAKARRASEEATMKAAGYDDLDAYRASIKDAAAPSVTPAKEGENAGAKGKRGSNRKSRKS